MTISISKYEKIVKKTDQFEFNEIQPILLGLFGEVGSVMSAVKKFKRESKAFSGYEQAVIDELGDTFWYFTALTRRYKLSVWNVIPSYSKNNANPPLLQASDDLQPPIPQTQKAKTTKISKSLLQLGHATSSLLEIESANEPNRKELLNEFAKAFFNVIFLTQISLKSVLEINSKKVEDRFICPKNSSLPTFDDNLPPEEQLPQKFKIEIKERANGKVYMRMNGVFIGAPLTDNIRVEDGFRFHDVIHFSHVAILHWSPTIRGLLKHKRKSDPEIDEGEDGGRGVVIEEGLAAWVFSKAKELDYFDGHNKVSIDILKTIQDFVKGYEVARCPAALWEKAILDGYSVFRQVKKNKGGYIIGNRKKRTLIYKPLEKENG